ncbi:UPF0496 protein 4-like [Phalaenopsis equestris]|uniref:UPF0496 protein 4-like n=1 Tax=Phalaenopsis equestris TaxID=78828 RepID=UPI0009E5A0E8|nr:UPF0496 protein 4-like [Phalaenopsis equestris]
MFLTEKNASPFSLFFSSSPKKSPARGIMKPFEETLITRLSSLLPIPDSSPSVPLSWLSRAVDLLTLTLADVAVVISDPSLSTTDRAALSSHLDSSVALLDACNAISATIDRILHGRLLVRLSLHLISSSPSLSPDRLRRARSAIAEWEAADASPAKPSDSMNLCRLRPKDPNRGRLTTVRRAIYAVEAISDLVARTALAFLGYKGDFLLGIRVSTDFAWAAAYNEVVEKISPKLSRGEIAGEIEKMKRSVRKLAINVDKHDVGEKVTEVLRDAVRGGEEAVEELTEGMDRMANAVNALFRAALETREAALECFRVRSGRCN